MKRIEWQNKSIVFIMATIATFMWGSAYPSIKIGYELFQVAHDDIGSKLVFAGYRFALAGLLVLLAYRLTYTRNPRVTKPISKDGVKRMLRAFLILGLMQTTLQYVFFYIGLANTTGSKGSIINASSAFFGVILAPLFYRDDKLNRRKIIGCIVGFAGILILNMDGGSLGGFMITGEGFVLMSTLMATFASFYSKAIVKKYDVFLTTGMQLLLGGLILLVIGLCTGGSIVFTPKGFALLIYMALISSVGFSLWTMLLKHNPASEITIYNLFIPVFGNILSGIFLGENIFTFVNIAAIILVSLGIIFVNATGSRKEVDSMINSALSDELRRYIEEHYVPLTEYAPKRHYEPVLGDYELPAFNSPALYDSDGVAFNDIDEDEAAQEDTVDSMPVGMPTACQSPLLRQNRDTLFNTPKMSAMPAPMFEPQESFSEMLLRKIDESGMTDAEVYKKAWVDRKVFSKIRCKSDYKPSRKTAFSFALALRMDVAEAEELLMKAGIALSDSSIEDLIIRFCIEHEIYDIMDVNELLSEHGQPLLGV